VVVFPFSLPSKGPHPSFLPGGVGLFLALHPASLSLFDLWEKEVFAIPPFFGESETFPPNEEKPPFVGTPRNFFEFPPASFVGYRFFFSPFLCAVCKGTWEGGRAPFFPQDESFSRVKVKNRCVPFSDVYRFFLFPPVKPKTGSTSALLIRIPFFPFFFPKSDKKLSPPCLVGSSTASPFLSTFFFFEPQLSGDPPFPLFP